MINRNDCAKEWLFQQIGESVTIAVWLMDSIDMSAAADTPNLYRLWHEGAA